MNINERAWSVIDALRDGWCYGPCGVQAGCGCADAIAEALRTVRRETLEEAARVADAEASRYPDYDRVSHQAAALNSATQIAQAIRSLAVKEGEGV